MQHVANIFEEQIHDSVSRGASAVADLIRRKHRGQASQQINAVCHSTDVIRRGCWPGRNLYILMVDSHSRRETTH
jgi:hypothetical protein